MILSSSFFFAVRDDWALKYLFPVLTSWYAGLLVLVVDESLRAGSHDEAPDLAAPHTAVELVTEDGMTNGALPTAY